VKNRGEQVKDEPPSPALLEITNNLAHKSRIIKNNLHELSVL